MISGATCGVLTAIFPIVLLTVVLERRSIHINIRRKQWFRAVTQVAVVATVGGLLLSVVGVQLGGYDWYLGCLVWVTFVVAVGCLTFNLIAAAASAEVEEDGPTDSA